MSVSATSLDSAFGGFDQLNRPVPSTPNIPSVFKHAGPRNGSKLANLAELKEVVQRAHAETKFLVLDFMANWCKPCRNMEPFFHQAMQKHIDSGVFHQIDVDQCPDLMNNFKVQSLPTILVLRGETVIDMLKGFNPEGLQQMCAKHAASSGNSALRSVQASAHAHLTEMGVPAAFSNPGGSDNSTRHGGGRERQLPPLVPQRQPMAAPPREAPPGLYDPRPGQGRTMSEEPRRSESTASQLLEQRQAQELAQLQRGPAHHAYPTHPHGHAPAPPTAPASAPKPETGFKISGPVPTSNTPHQLPMANTRREN